MRKPTNPIIRWLFGESGVTADQIKRVMFSDIHCINFMRERRKECHQMQGRYDGAMSEDCKQSFREQYEFWEALIQEEESNRESIKREKSKRGFLARLRQNRA